MVGKEDNIKDDIKIFETNLTSEDCRDENVLTRPDFEL